MTYTQSTYGLSFAVDEELLLSDPMYLCLSKSGHIETLRRYRRGRSRCSVCGSRVDKP